VDAFFKDALFLLKSTIFANLFNTPVNAALYTIQTTTSSLTMTTQLFGFVGRGTAFDAIPFSTSVLTYTKAFSTTTFWPSMFAQWCLFLLLIDN